MWCGVFFFFAPFFLDYPVVDQKPTSLRIASDVGTVFHAIYASPLPNQKVAKMFIVLPAH